MGNSAKAMAFEGSNELGVSNLWCSVNHLALVVSDVGRSLSFYSNIVGMRQVMRPDFDRHGAWLTMGNLDLHLIKGRPAVHSDDDLIVSHIAITVSDMDELRKRLKEMNVTSRKNISVPNPSDEETGRVEQAFVRDPDGYYIEFCNCDNLEKYLHAKMAEEQVHKLKTIVGMVQKMKKWASDARKAIKQRNLEVGRVGYKVEENGLDLEGKPDVCKKKLENLTKRQDVYGDITQNASPEELETLLRYHENHVPDVILALEKKVLSKRKRKYTPPAFFCRDGTFTQPPTFEMPATIHQNAEKKF